MVSTQTRMFLTILSLSLGLLACSSKPAFSLKQQNERWFCTPQGEDDWSCQQSAAEFNALATKPKSEQRQAVSEPESVPEPEKAPLEEEVSEEIAPETASQEIVFDEPDIAETAAPEQDAPSISPWLIQLAAYSREESAQALIEQVGRGELFETQVKGRHYFTVVVLGFELREEAQKAAAELQQQHPQLKPWIRSGVSFKQVLLH